MTPPVAPKITAAPVPEPSGESKLPSSKAAGSIIEQRSIRTSSRVVMTTSTSGPPQASFIVGSAASAFLDVHGMTEITRRFLGSTPIFSAK